MKITKFDEWLETLDNALDAAQSVGMSRDEIQEAAARLGDYLENQVQPDIPENKFLKELWQVADEEEKKNIAGVMIKYVESRKNR